jgi:hypothetical protein
MVAWASISKKKKKKMLALWGNIAAVVEILEDHILEISTLLVLSV